MDKKQASENLSKMVREAEQILKKAEEFAIEHSLSFDFAPAYGMGGTFYGNVTDELHKSLKEYHGMDEPGWLPSSQSC